MALRIVEVVLDPGNEDNVKDAIKDLDVLDVWWSKPSNDTLSVRILVRADLSEELVDTLYDKFSFLANFRLVIIPVEATLPRVEEKPKEEPPEEPPPEARPSEGTASEVISPQAPPPEEPPQEAPPEENKNSKKGRWIKRISREELHDDVADSSELTAVYTITVALSVLVAAIGLLKDNVAVVIGAMVIAPLLGPNMAMSLATTLGDDKLIKRSAVTLAFGIFLALGLSLVIGNIFEVDPTIREIALRTDIGLYDIVLALSSGAAGALFFTIGTSTALVGVMVAVALLPPLVTLGLLIGSGQLELAFQTLLLFMTNFICVNLAAVGIFVMQGIKPTHWWLSILAKKSSSYSLLIWISLLVFMVFLILFYS
ncbi:MAG: TIGR00341 family protein [Methanomassiliicoccales archaeon]|nr:TIGR00341 family protein [Methanomassiliicoccales archaeon]